MAGTKRAVRLVASTLLGLVFGIVCWLAFRANPKSAGMLDLGMTLGIILNRGMIGFAIGISGLKRFNFLLHGAIIGLVVSLLMSIYPLVTGDIVAFLLLELAGAIYGLLIELVVTKLFKAPIT